MTAVLNVQESFSDELDGVRVKFATGLIEPYQILDDKGQLGGLAPPIISCAMNVLKTEYTVDVLPWARAQKNVEMGHHDAFFVASRNDERDRYAKASAPLFSGLRSWVFRQGFDFDPDAEEFRKNGRVGSIFGTNMHSWLSKNYKNVVTKSDEQSLIELLEAGRVDAVLMTDAMHEHMMDANSFDRAKFNFRAQSKNPLGVYFGNSFLNANPEMLSLFNQALDGCVRDV